MKGRYFKLNFFILFIEANPENGWKWHKKSQTSNRCKEIRVGVRRKNLCVPETKRAWPLKALVGGCSVVSGSP